MRYIHWFITIALLTTGSCKKQSTFSGVVRSSADNQPVEGATVILGFSKGKRGGGWETISEDRQETDIKGQYALEVSGKYVEFARIIALKEGFAPIKPIAFDPGDCQELDFTLHPYDAWLKVVFENTSGTKVKEYYFNYSGEFLQHTINGVSEGIGPFKVQAGSVRSHLTRIPGGSDIYINWDTIRTGVTQFRNKVTKNCIRNDTTEIRVKI